MNKKTLFILVFLSLLTGVGLAGGLYLVSTPTNIAPKASDGTGFSLENPLSHPNPAVATPRREAGATPTPSGPVTREEIIASFGQNSPRADLNADGAVNSLDLSLFNQKKNE